MQKPTKWQAVKKRWRFFYMDNKLHRMLRVYRGRDEVIAWCYSERQRVVYSWSAVKRYGEPGVTSAEASSILNRAQATLKMRVHNGTVSRPEQTYRIPDGISPGRYIWRKSDVLKALDDFASTAKGRPAGADALAAYSNDLPSKQEVRAEMDFGMRLYSKGDDGKMVRIWEAEEGNF